MADDLGVAAITALGIRSHQPEKGKAAHPGYHDHIQHAVVGLCVPHRHESAAIIAAVADADDRGLLLQAVQARLDHGGAGDVGEEDVNPQGEEVGTGARDQREALIAVAALDRAARSEKRAA